MKVADKSREPVAEELAVLRRRIAELEKLEAGHKQAEEQLRKYREHLEELVEERTAELTTTNEQLQQEITKCKRAEEILQESERKYRSLFDNMLNGFAYCKILVDENNQPIDFIYLEVNDAFERLTGLRREDVIGRKVTEAIPGTKESHPGLFGIYGKVALTGEATEFDIDFKPLGISLAISVYSPQKGYFIAVFEDITKRKQAEQEIQLLLTLTQAISESQDFDAALGIAIGKVCQATGWDFGEAWVPSHDGKVLECSLAWYSSSNSLEKFRKLSEELTFPPNTGLPGRVWSSKQPEWIPDVSVASKVLFPRA
ncbi:MAG: PAS domain S-box protein, partial [Dehalococcoidales bacterium]